MSLHNIVKFTHYNGTQTCSNTYLMKVNIKHSKSTLLGTQDW